MRRRCGYPHNITTGVFNCNELEQWLFDEEGIDLEYEEWLSEHDPEEEEYVGPAFQGTTLYGAWKKDKDGLYVPDKRAKEDFAAIYNGDPYYTVQVVWSRWAIQCGWCSPCYPGQGDPSSRKGDVWAYVLPPDYMAEEWLLENQDRYWQYRRSCRGNWYWKKRKDVLEYAGLSA